MSFCGRLGFGDDTRVKAMAEQLGGRSVLQRANAAIWGSSAVVRGAGGITAWSPTPLPSTLPDGSLRELAADLDAYVVDPDDGVLHSSISGAAPLYADITMATTSDTRTKTTMHFCSRVDPLVRTRDAPPRPDWTAWAHIIASGGPLEGRTTFADIRRLPPWARLTPAGLLGGAAHDSHATDTPWSPADDWPWPAVRERGAAARLEDVRDALVDAVTALAEQGPLISLLSGGWDSRVLATIATKASARAVTGWTTSSDTGHALEQLVARQVADRLGMDHEIVPPRWDEFASDFAYFADAVEFQTSFHAWLVPLTRALGGDAREKDDFRFGPAGTVLDGLGGGIFVGGAFPDATRLEGPLIDHRFARLTHYMDAAHDVLRPDVSAQIRERTRASFTPIAEPLFDHRYGATFTAYLTRTLPGISMAPMGLIAGVRPTATPFLTDRVVRAALAIPSDQHAGGRLYPKLMRSLNAELADLPTAADLAPRHRRHLRRVSSVEAAAHIRELLLREPLRPLLADSLANADLDRWCTLLDRTKPQHLLRGLATLALWLERYRDVVGHASPDELLETVG